MFSNFTCKRYLQESMLTTCGKNGNKDSMVLLMKSPQEWQKSTATSVATVPGWPRNFSISYISKSHSIVRIVKSAHKNSELIARHRALRNKTNNLYRRLRNSHFKDRLLLHRASPRQLWTTIKYITNKQRLPLQVPVPLNDLSRYFERLLQQPGEYITLPYGPNNINSLQTFVPVTPTEIEGLLSQLNPRKNPLDLIWSHRLSWKW